MLPRDCQRVTEGPDEEGRIEPVLPLVLSVTVG